jgi:hypothetical protein
LTLTLTLALTLPRTLRTFADRSGSDFRDGQSPDDRDQQYRSARLGFSLTYQTIEALNTRAARRRPQARSTLTVRKVLRKDGPSGLAQLHLAGARIPGRWQTSFCKSVLTSKRSLTHDSSLMGAVGVVENEQAGGRIQRRAQ